MSGSMQTCGEKVLETHSKKRRHEDSEKCGDAMDASDVSSCNALGEPKQQGEADATLSNRNGKDVWGAGLKESAKYFGSTHAEFCQTMSKDFPHVSSESTLGFSFKGIYTDMAVSEGPVGVEQKTNFSDINFYFRVYGLSKAQKAALGNRGVYYRWCWHIHKEKPFILDTLEEVLSIRRLHFYMTSEPLGEDDKSVSGEWLTSHYLNVNMDYILSTARAKKQNPAHVALEEVLQDPYFVSNCNVLDAKPKRPLKFLHCVPPSKSSETIQEDMKQALKSHERAMLKRADDLKTKGICTAYRVACLKPWAMDNAFNIFISGSRERFLERTSLVAFKAALVEGTRSISDAIDLAQISVLHDACTKMFWALVNLKPPTSSELDECWKLPFNAFYTLEEALYALCDTFPVWMQGFKYCRV